MFTLCIPLFYIGLGIPPLIDPDEPVYAATGLAALHAGTFSAWWSPHYNGSLWFDKPPLTYWLIGLSEWLFGANPLAARLPSAICATVIVLLTSFMATRLWPQSKSAGFWAGVAIATSFQTVLLARAAVTDMILAALLTGAFVCMWIWLNDTRQVPALLVAGLCTGFATLTKGPVAIVLVGGSALFYLLMTRQFIRLLSPALWISLAIAVVIALPWYLSMIHLHGSLFIQGFLEANNLTRYLQPEHPQTSSIFWFFPVLMGFIFPWTVPLLCTIPFAIFSARSGDRASLYSLIWVIWVFAFFSLSETKLLTYIYPLYPVAAALIGRWIDSGPSRRQLALCAFTYCLVAVLIAVILPGYVGRGNGLAAARPILDQLCVVFLVSALVVGLSLLPQLREWPAARMAPFAVGAISIALFFSLVATAQIWREDVPDLSLKKMGEFLAAHTPVNERIIAFTLKRPSLSFYSSRQILFTDSPQLAANVIVSHPGVLCALKTQFLSALIHELPSHTYKIVLHSGSNYVLIKYQ